MTIEIYTSPSCGYCVRAKTLLRDANLSFTEIDIARRPEMMVEMVERTGRRTVPQIFFDGEAVGGYDELSRVDLAAVGDKGTHQVIKNFCNINTDWSVYL